MYAKRLSQLLRLKTFHGLIKGRGTTSPSCKKSLQSLCPAAGQIGQLPIYLNAKGVHMWGEFWLGSMVFILGVCTGLCAIKPEKKELGPLKKSTKTRKKDNDSSKMGLL